MKKLIIPVLILALMLCTACGGQTATDPTAPPVTDPETDVPETSQPEETPEAEVEETPDAGGDVDLAAFFESLASSTELPALGDADSAMIDALYPGLNEIAMKQTVVKMAMISAVVCEFAFIECESGDDVQTVADLLNARVQAQVDGGAWYPESIEGWEKNSRVVTNGNFVALIVIENCDEIVDSFNALFA